VKRELSLKKGRAITPQLLPDLAGANLTGLQSLSLNGVLRCNADVTTLVAAPPKFWATLEKLEFTDNGFHPGFFNFPVPDDGSPCVADVLHVAAPHMTKLRELVIKESAITTQGARLLERAVSGLREVRIEFALSILRLSNVRFGPGADASLFRAILGESLEELSLFCAIASEGASVLVTAAAGLPRMRHFEINHPAFLENYHDESLAVVKAAIEHWPLLETLILEAGLDGRAAQALGSTSRLTCLRKLAVGRAGFSCKEARILLNGRAAWLDTVKVLDLAGIQGDPVELARMVILAAPRLPSLTALCLDAAWDERESYEQMKRAFPRVNVHWAY
jgi:hypothetical protein